MKIIAYYIFSLFYYIGCLLPVRSNHYFCVMTHDSRIDSSVGVVIQAIKKEASNTKFILYTKETKTKWGKLSLLFLKPFQLASCKTILMDNEFLPLAYIHLRKDVKVIQLWHGTGTIKKFGHDVCSPSLLKVVQRADDKITHLIVNSEYTKRLYQRTFGLEESRVYLTGIPRTDQLFDMNTMEEKRRNFFSQYPELKDKRLFLYAPDRKSVV